jgi:hypothetical protein
MNYGRFKKATIWLALTCVFALPVAATFTSPVSAQGYHRRYDRRARYYYRRFQRIQIRVDRAPIEFYRVVVHYANGRSEEVGVRERIPAGGQTRAIDLRGDERAIDSVEFFYARGRWGYGREPRVRLYGII